MDKTFKVNVDKTFDFDLTSDQVEKLNIVSEEKNSYHILSDNQSVKVIAINNNFDSKQYSISVNSNIYQVKINNSLDQIIKDLGFSLGNAKKLNDIKAPMPGIIIDIEVKVGDEVKEGDPLLILEAMKMENAITSPKDAIIKSVLVKKGDTVNKSKLLIELE